jgi:hypothetical protein
MVLTADQKSTILAEAAIDWLQRHGFLSGSSGYYYKCAKLWSDASWGVVVSSWIKNGGESPWPFTKADVQGAVDILRERSERQDSPKVDVAQGDDDSAKFAQEVCEEIQQCVAKLWVLESKFIRLSTGINQSSPGQSTVENALRAIRLLISAITPLEYDWHRIAERRRAVGR